MKKLFFTLALIVSVIALSAQSFTVTEKATGNVVENGATYYISGNPDLSWGELNLELEVTVSEADTLIAEKIEIQVVEGTRNMLCLGMCYLPGVYVTPEVPFNVGEPLDFGMHYMPEDGVPYEQIAGKEQIMKYYLYSKNNPDDIFIVNVTFIVDLDGIGEDKAVESFSNAYPVPARDVVNFDYSFNTAVNAEVAIYNMMGQEVLRNSLNGMSGKASLNVSGLADGVYFYSLIVNGKTEKSSKLVIRK